MVKSMTGFGKGEATLQNKKITVEIRSLNSKQLDLGLRLPAVYRQSEYEIRNIITRTVLRGKVDVFVTVESQTVETPARINKEVFARLCRATARRGAKRPTQLCGDRMGQRCPAGHHAPAGGRIDRSGEHLRRRTRGAGRRHRSRRGAARRVPPAGRRDPDRRPAGPRGQDRRLQTGGRAFRKRPARRRSGPACWKTSKSCR